MTSGAGMVLPDWHPSVKHPVQTNTAISDSLLERGHIMRKLILLMAGVKTFL